MLIVLFAVVMQKSYLLDIAIVYVLLGFISIIFIANFIQKKGKI
jgi:multicomponent Na+:H+ antiporter subunit F